MIIAPDVSEFQPVQANDSFDRQWLIFRGCDGNHLDAKAVGNADWCRGALAEGRIVGWSVYVVYRPGMNAAVLSNVAKLGPVPRFEVDIESWPVNGKPTISGDHSDDINSLILDLEAVVGPHMVWRYGNHGDLAAIHPRPLAGQLTRIAGYVASKPTDVPNLVGWQFTNGVENHTSNPSSSPPFGACDHNELYVDELSPSGGGIQEDDVADFTPEEHSTIMSVMNLLNYLQVGNADGSGGNLLAGAFQTAGDTRTRIGDIQAKVGQLASAPAPVADLTDEQITAIAAQVIALLPKSPVYTITGTATPEAS